MYREIRSHVPSVLHPLPEHTGKVQGIFISGVPIVFFPSLKAADRRPDPQKTHTRDTSGSIKPCAGIMRTSVFFSSTGTCGSGEWIQPAVSDKLQYRAVVSPVSYDGAISGLRHSRHRTCKGTCRAFREPQKNSTGQVGQPFNRARIYTVGKLFHLPANTTDDTGSSCKLAWARIRFLKGCAVRMSP